MLLQPDLIGTAWIISTFTFALLWVTFIILFAIEWRQRIRDNKNHEKEMREIIFDYEHRLVRVEKDVQSERDWTEMLIQNNPLISQQIKDSLIADFKAGKGRASIPYEQNPEEPH